MRPGRQFLQLPGPTNLPERVQRALSRSLIDHRGPEFAQLAIRLVANLKELLNTTGKVALFPSSGTGAWEAALVNTLSPGDRVLGFTQGHFATTWHELAERLGLHVEVLQSDPRRQPDPEHLRECLDHDRAGELRAILLVHNETSTGVCVEVPAIRSAIDQAKHDALLIVDAISSFGSTPYQHDDWDVDVTVAASQKGLMLPPGLAFNAISTKALEASRSARLPRSYWDWRPHLEVAQTGWFPYTPPTTLLVALDEAITLLHEEGLENVFARHRRHAAITRTAVRGWGLDVYCNEDAAASVTVTTALFPEEIDAEAVRTFLRDELDLILGVGLGQLRGRAVRIGHLGSLNDLTLFGTLAGIELGLRAIRAGEPGGVAAALDAALPVPTAVT